MNHIQVEISKMFCVNCKEEILSLLEDEQVCEFCQILIKQELARFNKYQDLISKIVRALQHHEQLSKAYFFTPPNVANIRRSYEQQHSFTIEFQYNGDEYQYKSEVACSCNNVYYYPSFSINGQKKDVRLFKNLYKKMTGYNYNQI